MMILVFWLVLILLATNGFFAGFLFLLPVQLYHFFGSLLNLSWLILAAIILGWLFGGDRRSS